jgi:hypothetical protein
MMQRSIFVAVDRAIEKSFKTTQGVGGDILDSLIALSQSHARPNAMPRG